jgi:hypothetical protein
MGDKDALIDVSTGKPVGGPGEAKPVAVSGSGRR